MLEPHPPAGWKLYFNWALTIGLMLGLVLEVLPLSYVFVLATASVFSSR
ncbi:hypothetical protein KOE80_07275 [Alcaligenes sp. 13f]|nr:hypothetical protein [Alcaligenes sp. 13f]MCB4321997.1 hypothetical protein [Alcaligenes sp. 13f]